MTQVQGEGYDGPASKFDDSRFINASTLDGLGEVVVTVKEVISLKAGFKFENSHTLKNDTLCLRFTNSPKVLRLNKGNLRRCQKVLGPVCKDWVGKKLKVFTDPTVRFGGKEVGGVVVKQEQVANG